MVWWKIEQKWKKSFLFFYPQSVNANKRIKSAPVLVNLRLILCLQDRNCFYTLPRKSAPTVFGSLKSATRLVWMPTATVKQVFCRLVMLIKRCNARITITPTRNFNNNELLVSTELALSLSSLFSVSQRNIVCLCSFERRKLTSVRDLFWVIKFSIRLHSGHKVPASKVHEASKAVFSLMYFFRECFNVLFCTSSSSLIVFNCWTFCQDSSATPCVF